MRFSMDSQSISLLCAALLIVIVGFVAIAQQGVSPGKATGSLSSISRSFGTGPFSPGQELTIALQVSPGAGENVYALEEFVPAGFVVLDAGSANTAGCQSGGSCVLRWLYTNKVTSAGPVLLEYTVILPDVPDIYSFNGQYQFESDQSPSVVAGANSLQVVPPVVSCPNTYLMDYDQNDVIDSYDLDVFLQYYITDNAQADIDGDGFVTYGDRTCIGHYAGDVTPVYGFPPVTADCSLECASYVPYCGDSHADQFAPYHEQCDGSDVNGRTCLHFGYKSGGLSCSGTCRYDLSKCSMVKPKPKVPAEKITQ